MTDFARSIALAERACATKGWAKPFKVLPPSPVHHPYLRVIESLLDDGHTLGPIPDVPPVGSIRVSSEILRAYELVEDEGGHPNHQQPLVLIIAAMLATPATTKGTETMPASYSDGEAVLRAVRESMGRPYISDPGLATTVSAIQKLLDKGARLPSPLRYADLPKWDSDVAAEAASLIYKEMYAAAKPGDMVVKPATTGYTVIAVAALVDSLPKRAEPEPATPAPTPVPAHAPTSSTDKAAFRQAYDNLGAAARKLGLL